jgi:hypothetical protein
VKRHGHHAVSHVKGLFDAISVVHVDVNVQHARMVLEQFEDTQHDIIDVAEPRAFRLLGVVETAGPVDGNVTETVVEANSGILTHNGGQLLVTYTLASCMIKHTHTEGATGIDAAEVEDAVKDRTVRELSQVDCISQAPTLDLSEQLSAQTIARPTHTFLQVDTKILLVHWVHTLQEIDVLGRVEGLNFFR